MSRFPPTLPEERLVPASPALALPPFVAYPSRLSRPYPAASRRGPDLATRRGFCPAATHRSPALLCRPAAALPCRRPVAALRCRRCVAALPFSRPSRGPALPPPSCGPAPAEPRRPTEPCRPAEPRRPTELHCPTRAAPTATAASAATAAIAATAATPTMASPNVLTFDAEELAVDFDMWVDDLQHFLQCDSKDGVSLFDHTSGVSLAPAATADTTVRS
ncbi:unnamed protein product [Closterium sp. NIES-54]